MLYTFSFDTCCSLIFCQIYGSSNNLRLLDLCSDACMQDLEILGGYILYGGA